MKRFYLLALLLLGAAATLTTSCEKEESASPIAQTMAVTYASIHGVWQVEQINDWELEEETFCYINFNRSERTFTSYDNLASMYGRERSGSFSIEQDEYGRYILNGSYDYGSGDWATAYEVTMAASGEEMTWRSLTTDELVHYVRTEAMPERE
jgi:hypothetical protein